jgi:hypothetical protein
MKKSKSDDNIFARWVHVFAPEAQRGADSPGISNRSLAVCTWGAGPHRYLPCTRKWHTRCLQIKDPYAKGLRKSALVGRGRWKTGMEAGSGLCGGGGDSKRARYKELQ